MSYKKEKINDLEGKLVMKDNEIKEYIYQLINLTKTRDCIKRIATKKITTSQTGMPDAIPLFLEANVLPITFLSRSSYKP